MGINGFEGVTKLVSEIEDPLINKPDRDTKKGSVFNNKVDRFAFPLKEWIVGTFEAL